MSSTPPGWYQDPDGHPQQRWWNGQQWTTDVRPTAAAAAAPAPVEVAPVGAGPGGSGLSRGGVFLIASIAVATGLVIGWLARGGGDDSSSGSPSPTTVAGGSASSTKGSGSGSVSGSKVQVTPILEGLSNLNSYEWRMTTTYTGEKAGDTTQIESSGSSDKQSDSSYSKSSTTTTSTSDNDTSTSSSETWRVKDRTCTFHPDDTETPYETASRNPFELDLSGSLPGVLDLVVVSTNAQFVAKEQIAGVSASHYTFTVENLGTGSGAQVTANQGEMWVADDGHYLVRYQVTTGLRTAPSGTEGAQEFNMTLALELTSINQPVAVTLPAGCPAA